MIAVLDRPKITPDELLMRLDHDQYELVNGELVEKNMGWQSSRIGAKLMIILGAYVEQHGLGWVNGPDASYQCFEDALPDDPDRIRKPDVSFISLDRLPPEDEPVGYCEIVPDLAVEVVSPNDMVYELSEKVEEYLKAGVKLIWIVVPKTKTVRIYRANGSIDELHETQELSGEEVVPGFRCRVSELFRTPSKNKPQ
jgi:Uma2 family endonuclease